MFRKLQDTISSAASSAASAMAGLTTTNTQQQQIRSLQDMGFTEQESRQALNATDYDVNRAAELLFAQHTSSSSPTTGTPTISSNTDDETLQRIMQESYDMEEERRRKQQQQQTTRNPRTAAMNKAAEAAEKRHHQQQQQTNKKKTAIATNQTGKPAATKATTLKENSFASLNNHDNIHHSPLSISLKASTIAKTHPNVQLIPKLQDKSKEEQIIRCVDRMKPYPAAIDALYRVVHAIYQHCSNTQTTTDYTPIQKYRIIDTTNPSFQKNVANVPGAIGLLKAMNYRYLNNNGRAPQLILDIGSIDIALLYLGTSALEQAKETTEYQQSKLLIDFQKDVIKYMNLTNDSTEAAIECSHYMSLCPSEPKDGKGAYIQVKFASPPVPPSHSNDDSIHDNNNLNNRKISPKRDDNRNDNSSAITMLRRRFDGDDTLQDVIHWIASNMGGKVVIDKLVTKREWVLMDLNQYPPKNVIPNTITNMEQTKYQTLQYIGCWPSGKLELLPQANLSK